MCRISTVGVVSHHYSLYSTTVQGLARTKLLEIERNSKLNNKLIVLVMFYVTIP